MLEMDHYLFFFSVSLFLFLCHTNKTAADPETDRAALLSFRAGVVDPENALSSWSDGSSHCSWTGVSCSHNGTRVTSLQLTSLGLSGALPSVLSNISSIQLLDLSNNSFIGHIPAEFSRLSSLKFLYLFSNSLTGPIPTNLSQNLNLQAIFLDKNHLTGVIPSSLSNLSALTNLFLMQNQLRGQIPTEIGNLKRLVNLQLSTNNLNGEIPSSIYNISSLRSLSLAGNNLTGTLKTDFGLSFPNLRGLFLGGNRFHGKLPDSLSNLTEIEYFDLSWNSFSGSIPLFGKATRLRQLILGKNHLSSDTQQNLLWFDSLTNCTQLEILLLFANKLSGELPLSVSSLSAYLREFCIDRNLLTGQVPQGIGTLSNLISLSLEHNSFTGEMPISIGSLTRLQKLSLEFNQFSGDIPDIFGRLSQLIQITMENNRFTGRIPPSIAACQGLLYLNITGNMLTGIIPMEIFELPNLQILHMAENSLTGSVPAVIKNLRHVYDIRLSDNRLTGKVPATLGNISTLRFLDMARNNLLGPIPDALGGLAASLEILDLSSNNLSGPIPEELAQLGHLKNLNLSFNRLEGEIPVGVVFDNATVASLQGNNLLCSSNPETSRKFRLAGCVTKKENKKQTRKLKIIVLATVSLGFLLCVMLLVVLVLRARKKKQESGMTQHVKGLPPMISYNEIRAATSDFAAENLIGKGGSGFVYKGLFRSGIGERGESETLAVKVLNLQLKKTSKSYYRECEALRNARHRNLVKIITSCSSVDNEGDEFKALVMEFMPFGSLDQWLYPIDLESSCFSVLRMSQRLKILMDVAAAMDYLHNDCDPPIVHCDLKPGNVLLDEGMTAHVGDFGLARILHHNGLSQESITAGVQGSIGYIAPEYGLGGKANTRGDVYSFGILVLEMFIARMPTDEMFKEGLSMNKFALAAEADNITEILDQRLFLGSSESSAPSTGSSQITDLERKIEKCAAAAIKVGLECAAESANERLNMRQAFIKLKNINKSFVGCYFVP